MNNDAPYAYLIAIFFEQMTRDKFSIIVGKFF